jgi:DNA-binding transcriptional regulator YiaG
MSGHLTGSPPRKLKLKQKENEMANLMSALAEKISRIARKEIKLLTTATKKAATRYRHDIADLKRQVSEMTKRLAQVEKHQPKAITPPPEVLEKGRFRAMGVKAHRAKLGLSAANYGKLVGVSEVSVYNWETGKSRPRKAQLAKFLAIRGLGKREAMQRLGFSEPKAEAAPAVKPRGQFKQTAEEFVRSLVKSKKATTSSQINAAWVKAGRKGNADNTLSIMVKSKKLKRTKIKGERGSVYSVR